MDEQRTSTFKNKLSDAAISLVFTGLLAGIMSFYFNRKFEQLKTDILTRYDIQKDCRQNAENDLHFFETLNERLTQDEDYWESRRSWVKIGGVRSLAFNGKLQSEFERTLILSNHQSIIALLNSRPDLVLADRNLQKSIDAYREHVALYLSLRAVGDSRDPAQLGFKFPPDLLAQVEQTEKHAKEMVAAANEGKCVPFP